MLTGHRLASPARAEITVTNPNQGPVPVSGVTSSDGAFARVDGGTCGPSVPGGGQCRVLVQFAPQRLGRHATTLTVTSAGVGATSLDLTGTGVVQLVVAVGPEGFAVPADAVTVSGVGNCGGGCTATVSESRVTLTARALPEPDGGTWVGTWEKPCSDDHGVCSLKLSRDQSIVVGYHHVPPPVRTPG